MDKQDGEASLPPISIDPLDLIGRAKYLLEEYHRTGKVSCLNEAHTKAKLAVNHLPQSSDYSGEGLDHCALIFEERYVHLGALDDINEAIHVSKRAVEGGKAAKDFSESTCDLATLLNNLGGRLERRYARNDSINDLDEAILMTAAAVEARKAKAFVPTGGPDLPTLLNNLGNRLQYRFVRLNASKDINEAIETMRSAVTATTGGNPDLIRYLSGLGDKLQLRFEKDGTLADLEEAIEVTSKAAKIAQDLSDPDLANCLDGLGNKLERRFEQQNTLDDLEEAIRVTRKAIALTVKNAPAFARYLNNLGIKLQRRFEKLDTQEDLEEAINVAKRAIEATPENDPDFASRLTNLGGQLQRRFERSGTTADLEEAIRVTRRAIAILPNSHPALPAHLNNLGSRLMRRFQKWNAIADLDEAIDLAKKGVAVTPEESIHLGAYLTNLGSLLRYRSARQDSTADLEEAIKVARLAVTKTPNESHDLPIVLKNLANLLKYRFTRFSTLDDLEEAIALTRKAIKILPEHSPRLANSLGSLGDALEDRYQRLNTLDDLEEAIQAAEKAVKATPEDNPDLSDELNDLGRKLRLRSLHLKSPEDEKASVLIFHQSFKRAIAYPSARLTAAKSLIRSYIALYQWQDAAAIAEAAIRLLPLMHTSALSLQDQQSVLSKFSGLAVYACALWLDCGSTDKALEVLELGRGAIGNLVMNSQPDTQKLRASYPQITDRFEQLQATINQPTDDRIVGQRSRHEIVQERDKCIEEIRQLPGFERFLSAPSIFQMQEAAEGDYIVCVSINGLRSDAIVVSKNSVQSVSLPYVYWEAIEWAKRRLTHEEPGETRQDYGRRNKQYKQFLQWLWQKVVQPILQTLNLDPRAALCRIWWIGSGIASDLPFHAAGDCEPDSPNNMMSHAISSYVPTIQALINARARSTLDPETPTGDQQRMLLVTMPTTPGAIGDLLGVNDEARKIQQSVGTLFETVQMNQPMASDVIHQLNSYHIVHFACHGVSHPTDPARSTLLLQKTETTSDRDTTSLDPLSVQQILETKFNLAQLAFLSACSTVENPGGVLADEVIHIGSAFFIAGFTNVIGSMWPSDDDDSVYLAGRFYTHLTTAGRQGHTAAPAKALHHAVLDLWQRRPKQPLRWAPFTHIGT